MLKQLPSYLQAQSKPSIPIIKIKPLLTRLPIRIPAIIGVFTLTPTSIIGISRRSVLFPRAHTLRHIAVTPVASLPLISLGENHLLLRPHRMARLVIPDTCRRRGCRVAFGVLN